MSILGMDRDSWNQFREWDCMIPVDPVPFLKSKPFDPFDDGFTVRNINLLKKIPEIISILKNTNTVIAGGFVRYLISGGHMPEDIDIFTFTDEQFNRVRQSLNNFGHTEERESYAATTFHNSRMPHLVKGETEGLWSQNHYPFPEKIQVIKPFKLAKTPRDLMDTFDFIVCKCWLDAELNVFCHPDFKWYEEKKDLKTEDNGVPLNTIQRMFKYYRYGYSVPIEDLVRTMDSFAKLNPADRALAIERADLGSYRRD